MKKLFTGLLLLMAITSFAQKKTYNIGILIDTYEGESVGYLYELLQKEIKAVVGEDANIVFDEKNVLNSNYDIKKSENNYNDLIARCDIILSLGVFNNIAIQQVKEFPKPVIMIGNLGNGVVKDITKNTTSGKHNLLYLTAESNILTDLETLRKLADFDTVGIVVEQELTKVIDFKSLIDEAISGTDIKYKLIPYSTLSDITNNLDGIDALLLTNSFSLTQTDVKQLSEVLIEKKIPSFSSIRKEDVENGIMATNASNDDFTRFFRRIALSIEEYVNGTNFSELPVLIDFVNKLTINRNTALAMNISLRYGLVGQMDFVGQSQTNPKAQIVYDLPVLINEVLTNNLSLIASEKGVQINEQNIKSAKSNYLPSVTANATATYIDPEIAKISNGQNPQFSTSGNIALQQLIFSADASTNIKIQKSLAQAQREKFNAEELDLIFNTVNAYFNVLMLKTNAEIQTRNLALTKKNLQIAEENFNGGQSGKTDLLRFRSQKAQNNQALIEAVNQVKKGYIVINQLTNSKLDYEIDVKDAGFEDEIFKEYNYDEFMNWAKNPLIRNKFIDFLVQEAINNAPELKQLTYNIDATQQQIKLYGSGRFIPTAVLQGRYNYQFSRSGEGTTYPQGFPTPPDGGYNFGINVSLPIFNKNTNKINRQTAFLQQEQLEINKSNLETAITANIYNGVLDLINQITNIELSKVSEEAAKEALDLTQTAYSTGAVNIVQLIDAQNNYLNAQQAKANATYNYLIKMLQLERFLGSYFLLSSEQDMIDFNQRFLEFTEK